jgi:hypothetical protein
LALVVLLGGMPQAGPQLLKGATRISALFTEFSALVELLRVLFCAAIT